MIEQLKELTNQTVIITTNEDINALTNEQLETIKSKFVIITVDGLTRDVIKEAVNISNNNNLKLIIMIDMNCKKPFIIEHAEPIDPPNLDRGIVFGNAGYAVHNALLDMDKGTKILIVGGTSQDVCTDVEHIPFILRNEIPIPNIVYSNPNLNEDKLPCDGLRKYKHFKTYKKK